jgi:hypothetical protein
MPKQNLVAIFHRLVGAEIPVISCVVSHEFMGNFHEVEQHFIDEDNPNETLLALRQLEMDEGLTICFHGAEERGKGFPRHVSVKDSRSRLNIKLKKSKLDNKWRIIAPPYLG